MKESCILHCNIKKTYEEIIEVLTTMSIENNSIIIRIRDPAGHLGKGRPNNTNAVNSEDQNNHMRFNIQSFRLLLDVRIYIV